MIKKIKEKTDTLRILALSYSWVILGCGFITMTENFYNGLGIVFRGLLFLSFMYHKNNWRILMLILSAIGVASSIAQMSDIFFVLDILGNAVVFVYALKERK